MPLHLFLASCTVAAVVYAIHSTLFFEWFRRWCDRHATRPTAHPLTKWLVYGLRCPYCLSHWIAAVTVAFMAETWGEAAILLFPTVWMASHALEVHRIVHEIIPFAQATLHQRRQAEAAATKGGPYAINR